MMISPAGGSDEILATLAGLLEGARIFNQGLRPFLERGSAAAPNQEVHMARKAGASLDHALDLWLGELARAGKSDETRRKYRWLVDQFCAMFEHRSPSEIATDDCRRFLDRWASASVSTMALHVSILRCFFEFLRGEGIVDMTPMDPLRIRRPRRPKPEDIDVVSVSARDVRLMFAAVESWQELICLGVLCYCGVRRRAAANARRKDVALETGMIKFREKGGKVIVKPIPDELAAILKGADAHGVWATGNDWLIPNREYRNCRKASLVTRSNRIVYDTVKNVAGRVGVDSHCHALRAAFAVQYDEMHPGHTVALKELLGHERIETTMVYLRRKDKQAAMETVRNLSWNQDFALPAEPVIPPAGFEPALPAKPHGNTVRAVTDTCRVPASLQAKLDQLSKAAKRART